MEDGHLQLEARRWRHGAVHVDADHVTTKHHMRESCDHARKPREKAGVGRGHLQTQSCTPYLDCGYDLLYTVLRTYTYFLGFLHLGGFAFGKNRGGFCFVLGVCGLTVIPCGDAWRLARAGPARGRAMAKTREPNRSGVTKKNTSVSCMKTVINGVQYPPRSTLSR